MKKPIGILIGIAGVAILLPSGCVLLVFGSPALVGKPDPYAFNAFLSLVGRGGVVIGLILAVLGAFIAKGEREFSRSNFFKPEKEDDTDKKIS